MLIFDSSAPRKTTLLVILSENDKVYKRPLKNSKEFYLIENEKLSKRKKTSKEMLLLQPTQQVNLLDFWTGTLNENNKNRLEFFGRAQNPTTQIVPLYINLKIEETASGKSMG